VKPQLLKTPGISPELLKTTIILILGAALIMWSMSCGVVNAIEGFFIGSTDAAEATEDAARQAEETLHTLQHAILYVPVYLAGIGTKPLWNVLKNRKNKHKKV